MTEGTDLEELMDELYDHTSDLAENKDELDQAIEEGNESFIRNFLSMIGAKFADSAAWDLLKIAVKKALGL